MAQTAANLLKEDEYIKLKGKRDQVYVQLEMLYDQFNVIAVKPEVVSAKRFLALESELNDVLAEVKKRQDLLIQYYIRNSVDISTDAHVKEDKKDYIKRVCQINEEADQIRVALEGKKKLPTLVKEVPASNISELCTTLTKSLNTSALKPSQPIFEPTGSNQDFMKYKEWRSRFIFFVKNLDEIDQHVWLKNSLKGEALAKIKSISEAEGSYAAALELLDNSYLKSEPIKQHIFYLIYNFKVESQSVIKILNSMHKLKSNLTELKVNFKYDDTGYGPDFVANIIMRQLPHSVKKHLIYW